MVDFSHNAIKLDVLRKRSYNMRWAEVPEGVIPLTAADPDFPVAPEIVEEIISYAKEGYFPYTPKLGFPELKESIANALWDRKQEKVDPDLILPIDSAARGMEIIAKTVLKPGDEAIVFDPVDFLFTTSARLAGANIVSFPANIKNGRIDLSELEKYITPKTKLLGLCNPHNPLGMVYSMQDLDYILQLSEKYGFYIMNDEIWSDIIYPEARFYSIVTLGEKRNARTLSVSGFSKSFGIAGLRAGYIYCHDQDLFDKIVDTSLVLTTIGGITSISQVAAMACLNKCYYWVDAFVKHLTKNRDYALDRIACMPKIKCHKPSAVYVLFPNISETGMDSTDFVNYLLKEYKLSIVPGGPQFFGPRSAGHVRICLATSFEILKEGLNRLNNALEHL